MTKVYGVRLMATKEQLQAAMQQDKHDTDAILFFLLQAEKDGLMLAGHKASDVLAAAARRCHVSQEELQELREKLA